MQGLGCGLCRWGGGERTRPGVDDHRVPDVRLPYVLLPKEHIRSRLADKGEAPLPFLRQRDKRHGGDRLPAGLPPDTAHPVFPEGAQQVPPEVVIPHRAAHGRLQPVPGGGDGHICRGAPGVSNIASGLTARQKVN